MKESTTSYRNPNQYNVYNQKIDSKNQMPIQPNQLPSSNQAYPLSTDRVTSNIPKAGTDSNTWLYPSPQMFWNAIVRKNKVDGVSEKDVSIVVAIHNNMNEKTWKSVMEWELLHPNEDSSKSSKLLRFLGRPDDISPKAFIKTFFFGYPKPFDRHDWIVDRGGKEVRYIIDYYHDESIADSDKAPKGLTDATSIQSIKIDVRPAIDSLESLVDRMIYMPILMTLGETYII
jgi:cytochrome c heme-lyase